MLIAFLLRTGQDSGRDNNPSISPFFGTVYCLIHLFLYRNHCFFTACQLAQLTAVCFSLDPVSFIWYAQRSSVHRLDLSPPYNDVTFKIDGLKTAVAIDYDYKKMYLFWADISTDKINKLSINGCMCSLVFSTSIVFDLALEGPLKTSLC